MIGARTSDENTLQTARELGQLLAQKGYTVICGGMGGVMEAVCRGAKEAGGTTIGVLPGDDPAEANPFIDTVIVTGQGISRNLIIIRSAVAVIAISGGYGTLSELAFALQLGKPVIGIDTWDISEKIFETKDPAGALFKLTEILNTL